MISNEINSIIDNYNDYLLSKNIALILKQEYGIETINIKSLLLITKILSSFITDLSHNIKKSTELTGREDSNIIDLLFTLSFKNKTQKSIINYINKKNTLLNNNKKFEEIYNIKTIINNEEKQRINILEELNCIHVPQSNCINKSLLDAIPKNLRYFPREFTLKNSENIIENNENNIKEKNEIKKLEKKNLEGIISGNNYYEINQKKRDENNEIEFIDLPKVFESIVKDLNNNNNNEIFGLKFNIRRYEDERKDNEDIKGNTGLNDAPLNNNMDMDIVHDSENEINYK